MADMNEISENLLIEEHVKPCKISTINDIHIFLQTSEFVI